MNSITRGVLPTRARKGTGWHFLEGAYASQYLESSPSSLL